MPLTLAKYSKMLAGQNVHLSIINIAAEPQKNMYLCVLLACYCSRSVAES